MKAVGRVSKRYLIGASYLVDGGYGVIVVLDGVLYLRQRVVGVVEAVVGVGGVAAPVVGTELGALRVVVAKGEDGKHKEIRFVALRAGMGFAFFAQCTIRGEKGIAQLF